MAATRMCESCFSAQESKRQTICEVLHCVLMLCIAGTLRAKEEAAAALRIACDGSEQNASELLKCSGISALIQLLSVGSVIAREESVAAIANACSYFPPNLEFIGEAGKGQLHAVCTSKELSEEARLYAKCVLMQVDLKGPKLGSIGVSKNGDELQSSSKPSFHCPEPTNRGEKLPLEYYMNEGVGEWVSLPPVRVSNGFSESRKGRGGKKDNEEEEEQVGVSNQEPPVVKVRYIGVSLNRYRPHAGALEPPPDSRWPNMPTFKTQPIENSPAGPVSDLSSGTANGRWPNGSVGIFVQPQRRRSAARDRRPRSLSPRPLPSEILMFEYVG